MASEWGAADEADIHRVTCVRHPKGSKEFYFCFDCCRVFCGDCRDLAIERVNHQPHRTATLQEVLSQRKQRMASIRKLIGDYVKKHDTLLAALHTLEAEQKTRTNELINIIDDFASQLFREVENMKTEAKAAISKRVSKIWSANPAETRRQEIDKGTGENARRARKYRSRSATLRTIRD